MTAIKPTRPEDVLADGVDTTVINGKTLRKGTVAAFLANTETLQNPQSTEEQKQEAIRVLKELAPAVVTLGLHKYVTFKNSQVEQILIDAESNA